ncbi:MULTISPECIES: acyl-CoA dehydrogenase family protein [Achromobacter]|uniref:Acyl-CoA dehydrogenase n=1 Tax=Alcaligenes xylosoxydans xylosoxydans TaxID=85698 RepID=A0A424WK35_ALCXX|nr:MULTISPECIES: acyl-CoA dehydrogenase family protein [Achromobacter]MBC9904092.1 acyl-CoA/acyl-ACP dehydrogenase [Achromobacter xylosoxidans]MBD0867949.1 acyl-CoA/acyl-ACP dehydrogenase [Achromobacter xylosoxidans]MDH1301638.1 acyl-CoA/acyl-ACP dehydrogenase [Achromobacter sp. GD03932]QNP86608.1 acyl-CoA/acyl-ACP dehydrogenase [Achromobacter xylosoxidans]RPJ93552.1 acyl-CoA dehydrogenase [Achromobacter xylosoxidans]
MNFTEPDHIRQLRDTLERFVEKEMPRGAAADWDKRNHFPREVFDKLARLGVMGLTVPEAYGGAGRDILATMVVIEELSRRSLAVSVPYIMSACYAGMNLVECATEAQKTELLPKVVDGTLVFAYGWTEPDAGADLASVKTRAERVGDSVRINGAKRFCSGAAISDYIYALVRSGNEGERYKNLSMIMIPPDTKGVTITPIEGLGMKGAATTDVIFEDVEVPFENVMGGEAGWNNGWQMIVGSGLDVEKLEVAAIGIGVARAALDDAWAYAGERQQFGKTINHYQSIQHKLADMKTQLHAARLVLYHAAWMANEHQRCGVETSMAKLFATETARSVALECQTIFGAYGYVKDFDAERYVRDALLLPIIGGSSAVQRNNIYKWSGANA